MGVEMGGVREPEVTGGYRLGRRLDAAGSAETYQATGPDGEVMVLKVLRDVSPELASGMSARLAAAPRHQSLIIPSAWGRDGDDFYVVRDYIPGIDLESMIQAGGPLEPSLAGRYLAQAASAVAAIEAQGVSHGNLKTSDLLVSAESDQVKVLGWGMAIANILPEGESRAAATA
jgi:serine/threonine protein kinase